MTESACAICGGRGDLLVDVDPFTGARRGRLCEACLSLAKMDPARLMRAAQYLLLSGRVS